MRDTTTARATMTVAEAAKVLGIGRAAAYAAANRGDSFPVKRIGKKILIPTKAFFEWLGERDAA